MKGVVFIYRQELLNDIAIFTSQPKQRFYSDLFLSLNLNCLPLHNCKFGRKGATNHAFVCSFIVMKCEGFSQVSDLHDYLTNNLIIAHYCGFNINKPLPSYASFTRFIRNFDNDILQSVMQESVLKAISMGLVDSSFIALDSTTIKANVCNNNPKAFMANKFSKKNHPTADKDCYLGVQTASNSHSEKNFEFYWGYKNHIVVDCISGLPIYEVTTGANIADYTVCIGALEKVHSFMPLDECYFLADKAYDVKDIYNTVKMFITVNVIYLSIHAVLKILKNFQAVDQFARLLLLCIVMVFAEIVTVNLSKSFVVLLNARKMPLVP